MTRKTNRDNGVPKQERTDSSNDFTDDYEVERTHPERFTNAHYDVLAGRLTFSTPVPGEFIDAHTSDLMEVRA